jgi:hypothetical protein
MRNIDEALANIEHDVALIQDAGARSAVRSILWALRIIRNEIPSLDPYEFEDERLERKIT